MKDASNESGESVRKGQEAIELLGKLIEVIEKGDMEELTDRQALIMVRVAKARARFSPFWLVGWIKI